MDKVRPYFDSSKRTVLDVREILDSCDPFLLRENVNQIVAGLPSPITAGTVTNAAVLNHHQQGAVDIITVPLRFCNFAGDRIKFKSLRVILWRFGQGILLLSSRLSPEPSPPLP